MGSEHSATLLREDESVVSIGKALFGSGLGQGRFVPNNTLSIEETKKEAVILETSSGDRMPVIVTDACIDLHHFHFRISLQPE